MSNNMINDPEVMLARLVAWYLDAPYDATLPMEPIRNLEEEMSACYILSCIVDFMENYLKNHGLK